MLKYNFKTFKNLPLIYTQLQNIYTRITTVAFLLLRKSHTKFATLSLTSYTLKIHSENRLMVLLQLKKREREKCLLKVLLNMSINILDNFVIILQ